MNPESTKIRRFNFLQFSWPQVHENPQKSDDSIFLNFHDHENPQRSDHSIFFNFHDTGYIKILKNQTLWFSSTFMTQGVHENQQKSDDSIFTKNQTLWFYSIFKKIEAYDFCGFSCTRGHESWWKSKCLIFVDFHVPGHESWRKLNRLIFVSFHVPVVMKIEENWIVWFLRIFMYPGSWKLNKIELSDFCGFSWKLKKIEVSDFCEFSCTWGHEKWRKLNRLIFVDFHVPVVPLFYLITQKSWLNMSKSKTKTKYKHFKGQKLSPGDQKLNQSRIWAHQ